jgi:hypothetical protein
MDIKTHLFDGKLFICLDLDLPGLLSSFLRDERYLSDASVSIHTDTERKVRIRTILFISDWISASFNAPVRDILLMLLSCRASQASKVMNVCIGMD